MQYTLYSLLRKHGEVMSEKSSKNHFVGYIQNGNCQIFAYAADGGSGDGLFFTKGATVPEQSVCGELTIVLMFGVAR